MGSESRPGVSESAGGTIVNKKKPLSVFVVIGSIILAGVVIYVIVRWLLPFGSVAPPPSEGKTGRGYTNGNATTLESENSNKKDLGLYPDLPLLVFPRDPQSVKFIIEHRSALNQKSITVRGIVVDTAFQRSFPCTTGPCPMYGPASGVVLADDPGAARDKQYDLTVLLGDDTPENEKMYPVGRTVEIIIQVWGSRAAVLASKIMPAP